MTCAVVPTSSVAAEQHLKHPMSQSIHPTNNQSISQTIKLVIPESAVGSQRPSISTSPPNHRSINQSFNLTSTQLLSSSIQRIDEGSSVDESTLNKPSVNQLTSLSTNPMNSAKVVPSSHRRSSLDVEQPLSQSAKQSINLDEEVIALKNDFGQIISIATPNSRSMNHNNPSVNQSINPITTPSTPTFVQSVSLPAPSPITNPSFNQSQTINLRSSESRRSICLQPSNQLPNQPIHQSDVGHPFVPEPDPSHSNHQSSMQSNNRPRIQIRASMESLPLTLTATLNSRSNSQKTSSTMSPSLSPTRNPTNNQSVGNTSIRGVLSPRQEVAFRAVTKEIKERSLNQSSSPSGNQSARGRTLNTSNSSAHLKLPFFSPTNQSGSPTAIQATSKTAGPEGFLASLSDPTPETPVTQPIKTNKRATFNPRKPSFFNSVKQVLKRSSFQSVSTPNNQSAKPTIAYSAQVSLSPQHQQHHSVIQSSNHSPDDHLSTNLSNNLSSNNRSNNPSTNQSNNHRGSFSHPQGTKSPPSDDQHHSINGVIVDPCVYTHGINRGSYGQSLTSAVNQSSLASITAARKLALATNPSTSPSNSEQTNDKFIESWSESDDPLSPASFQQVIPGIYLGSAKSALNIDRLIEHRITHIVTVMNRPLNFLAQPGDAADADILYFNGQANNANNSQTMKVPSNHPLFGQVMHALTFHFCYLLDIPEADLLSALEDCLPFIHRAHAIEKGHILIHCQAGISRSASVVIAYIAMFNKLTIKRAFECCSLARPYINPNEGFLTQLDLWYRTQQRKKRQERLLWLHAIERFAPWTQRTKRGRQLIKLAFKAEGKWSFNRALPTEARAKEYT